MSDIMGRISAAFAASPVEYLEGCLEQRNPGLDQVGSRFLTTQTLESLQSASWEEYSHPSVMEGCVAFSTPIKGRVGVVQLSELDPATKVTLDDRKNTGKVSAVVEGVLGAEVDITVLILGPHEGREVVYTFHPGEPIDLSVSMTEGRHGETITVAAALELGLKWAKIG